MSSLLRRIAKGRKRKSFVSSNFCNRALRGRPATVPRTAGERATCRSGYSGMLVKHLVHTPLQVVRHFNLGVPGDVKQQMRKEKKS